jgi:4-cresol dehydrogenase (hydroxylating)
MWQTGLEVVLPQGDVMRTGMDWGDGALLKFHEAIKDALDPNGVIAPGKSGVWSARYRDQDL